MGEKKRESERKNEGGLRKAALAIFLIDKIRRSADSTVKIDQSEVIAVPAIPEEGR